MKKGQIIQWLGAALLLGTSVVAAAPAAGGRTWIDPESAKREDPDFSIQGEYSGDGSGVQVIALGNGEFEASILEGGLPGAGWEPGNDIIHLRGKRDGTKVVFRMKDADSEIATLENGVISLIEPASNKPMRMLRLPRVERKSPTLGAKPPEDAVVLFDGTSADAWENGKMENGLLLATGCTSRQRFGSYTLHLEFRTPYKPDARGQQRGNSGIYHSGRWETQILDSFGLEGRDNECGGIYSISKPRLNACLPPLAWQTYDVDFTAATYDAEGRRTAWPRITVKLNGITVHENLELAKDFTTAAPINKPLTAPDGPIFLQNHGNPVVFRNIWVVPR